MRQILVFGFLGSFLLLWGCEEEPGGNGIASSAGLGSQDRWSIPLDQIFDGGPGLDGIPALEEIELIFAEEADFLEDDDLVLGFVSGEEVRAYPHKILDWHEIINDQISEEHIAITYCPLTGTGIAWNREIEGKVTTFGVSGLLYNSNLIPYDRSTSSNWSQIRLDCVNGKHRGKEAETYPLIETTWLTWKEMYPNTGVVSRNTGFNRDYGRYPYGNYRTANDYLIFPVANEDDRIPNKERVLGIVHSGNARVYRFADFGENVSVVHDTLEGENLVIVGNQQDNFMLAFIVDGSVGPIQSLRAVQGQYPIVMEDDEGNLWDVAGRAVAGPRKDSRLGSVPSFIGYWFSFAAFYPDLSIYGDS